MDCFLYVILFSVFSLSEMQPVTDNKSVLLKLPKEITNGTFISIAGEINNNDKLSIALSGDNADEKCRIVFDPRLQNIKVISKTENNTTYNLHHNGKNPVSFSLNITARTVMEQTENHFLDLDFEGNEAGPELLARSRYIYVNFLITDRSPLKEVTYESTWYSHATSMLETFQVIVTLIQFKSYLTILLIRNSFRLFKIE